MGRGRSRGASKQAKRERGARAAKLDALYAELPSLRCKGLCKDSCGPIDPTPVERQRIREAGGPEIPPLLATTDESVCPALDEHGRCGVYDVRPMICRLWGIGVQMRCPHGCEPDGGWISAAETQRFLMRSYLIGGWPASIKRRSPREIAEFLRGLD
ncbi:MAG: YkgJ family cysteine cluster protein [Actinomycetota bacterium]|nr:YkgJ family cysteine cluster protein [Actinomycetota bacterium]